MTDLLEQQAREIIDAVYAPLGNVTTEMLTAAKDVRSVQMKIALAALRSLPAETRTAFEPFALAAGLGMKLADAFEASGVSHHLIGFAGYVGKYEAQSHVSWANWKRLRNIFPDAS